MAIVGLTVVTNCTSNIEAELNDNFMEIYQKAICDKYSLYANKTISSKLKLRHFPKNGMPQNQDSTSQKKVSLKLHFQNEFKLKQGSKSPSVKT